MQPLVLYGHPWNRAARCLWMLRELALPHELKQVALLSSDFDELNQNRKQPYLYDANAGGAALFESMAINLHLVEEYAGGHSMAPRSAAERAALRKWTVWAQAELDMLLFEAMFYSNGARSHPLSRPQNYLHYFDRAKTPERLARIKRELEFPLGVLNSSISDTSLWLVGDRFTAADLNVASVAMWAVSVFGFTELNARCPRVAAWLTACLGRKESPLHHTTRQPIPKTSFSKAGMADRMQRGGGVSVGPSML